MFFNSPILIFAQAKTLLFVFFVFLVKWDYAAHLSSGFPLHISDATNAVVNCNLYDNGNITGSVNFIAQDLVTFALVAS